MIKTYTFDYDSGEASAVFTVDTEKFTSEMANETLNFFTWDFDNEEDPLDEVMKKYAMQAIRFATINNHNAYGVILDFKEAEGFAPVDGSLGITLTSVRGYEFDDYALEMVVI